MKKPTRKPQYDEEARAIRQRREATERDLNDRDLQLRKYLDALAGVRQGIALPRTR